MAARLTTRFPLTAVDDKGCVTCPALRLTGPEAKALRVAALSLTLSPAAPPLIHAAAPDLPPAIAAALTLLWVDALQGLPREPFLDFAFTALRHLEGHGAAYLERVLALHSELHPRVGDGVTAVPFAAPQQQQQQQQQQGAATQPAPPKAPPLAAAAPALRSEEVACGVSAQGLWSLAAHRAFEVALRATFHCPAPARVTDAHAWERIAAAIALPGVTAQACLLHFASLARAVSQWSVERGLALLPAAATAAPTAAAANATAAAATPFHQQPAAGSGRAARGGAFLELLLQTTAPPGAGEAEAAAAAGAAGSRRGSEGALEEAAGPLGGEAAEVGEEEEEEEEEGGEEYEEEVEDGIISVMLRRPMLHGVFLTPPPLSAVSYVVDLKGLHLSGVGALVCSLVHLGVTCERCGTLAHMPLPGAHIARGGCCPTPAALPAGDGGGGGAEGSAGGSAEGGPDQAEVKQWCAKCSLLLSCRLRAGLIHEGAASLGYVVAVGCAAQVASCAELWASCLECGEPHCIPRFTPGSNESSCQRCHARLKLECRDWEVEVRAGGRAPAQPAAVKPGHTRYPTGRPLPGGGACEHFKKSFRWLRFACCGLAFPCPACHDAAQSHPHERAKRMLCGHCSREQPFHNSPCVACGEDLCQRAARTSHWEGGEGQRVQALLSSKDRRKYTGLAKVASAKGTRVGTAKARAAAAVVLGREAKKAERPGQ